MSSEIKKFEGLERKRVKIDPEILAEAKIVVQIVGGDYGMKVRFGKPGYGSSCNPETATVTLDIMQFIKEDDPRLDELRKAWRSYFENLPEIKELIDQINRTFNEGLRRKLRDRLNGLIQKKKLEKLPEIFPMYFPEIKKEDLDMDELLFILGHEGGHRAITCGLNEIGLRQDKINELARKIGFFYGDNAVEDPADNNWVRNIFPGIGNSMKKFYDKQTKAENIPVGVEHPDVQRAIAVLGYIPRFAWFGGEIIRYWWKKRFSKGLSPEIRAGLEKVKKYLPKIFNTIPQGRKTRKEAIKKRRERFIEYYENVWPELEKLVKMDIDDEAINQMIKKMEDEIARQLEEDLKKELKTHREQREKRRKYQELEKRRQELRRQNRDLDRQIEDLKKKAQGASGQKRKDLEEQIQRKRAQKKQNQQKQKEIEGRQKVLQGQRPIKQEQPKLPFSPLENLSPRLKKKLKRIFDNLSNEEKKKLKKIAKEKLGDLEDKLNDNLEGRLNKDNPKPHWKIRDEDDKKNEEGKRKKSEKIIRGAYERAKEGFRKELEKRKGMSDWERTRLEVKPIIDKLYQKLKRVLEPLEGEWEGGYISGSKMDLRKAVQTKIRPELKMKMWEKRRRLEELKYRFVFLFDTSETMIEKKGVRMEESFKALVALTEVLNKFGIPEEIIAFSTKVKRFKSFKEKLNKNLREELSKIKSYDNNWTYTYEATVYAGEEIRKNRREGENIFLITLTDGQANGPNAKYLPGIIRKFSQEGIKQIYIGLGSGAEFVKDICPTSLYLPRIELTEADKKEGKKDFVDLMAKLLEQIIHHPEKFSRGSRRY